MTRSSALLLLFLSSHADAHRISLRRVGGNTAKKAALPATMAELLELATKKLCTKPSDVACRRTHAYVTLTVSVTSAEIGWQPTCFRPPQVQKMQGNQPTFWGECETLLATW